MSTAIDKRNKAVYGIVSAVKGSIPGYCFFTRQFGDTLHKEEKGGCTCISQRDPTFCMPSLSPL